MYSQASLSMVGVKFSTYTCVFPQELYHHVQHLTLYELRVIPCTNLVGVEWKEF